MHNIYGSRLFTEYKIDTVSYLCRRIFKIRKPLDFFLFPMSQYNSPAKIPSDCVSERTITALKKYEKKTEEK